MNTTGYLYSPVFLEHQQAGHPECSERLAATYSGLEESGLLSHLTHVNFAPAAFAEITRVHDAKYVRTLQQYAERGGGALDASTYVMSQTYKSASWAVGAAIAATRSVLIGEVERVFALVRPPGHHAHADHGEGFCFFNNIAFSALTALGDVGTDGIDGVERVMIVDWDVHHGNGTESLFYTDPRVLYVSLHEHPLYPMTGALDDIGAGAGRGFNVNIPLPSGVGDNGYLQVLDEVIEPLAERFHPQLLLVSSGYDVHWREPLARMSMSLTGVSSLIARLMAISQTHCGGKLVMLLEGGYDLQVLKHGVANTFRLLCDQVADIIDPLGKAMQDAPSISRILQRVKQLHQI